MNCPYCNSENIGGKGYLPSGKKRYKCKECGKTFTKETVIVEKLPCPYCGSHNVKAGGKLKSGAKRYLCKECGKNFSEKTVVKEEIPDNISCPDCNSHNLRRVGKSKYGVQRYLCKDCGRKFVEVVMVRPKTSHQVVCPVCGNKFARKAGHTGSGNQYWKCTGCGHKFLDNPRYKHATEEEKEEMRSLALSGYTAKEIGEKLGKTARTVKSILERMSTSLLQRVKLSSKIKLEEKRSSRLKSIMRKKEEKIALKKKKEKEIEDKMLSLFQKEGLTHRQIASTLHVSGKKVQEVLRGLPSRDKILRQEMISKVLKGKPVKEIAKEYNYNLYSLNKLLKPYYERETLTSSQKLLIIKYGIFLKVPVNYLAEYVPCSERKCKEILESYKRNKISSNK